MYVVSNKDILEAVANDEEAVKYRYFVENLGVPVSRTYYEAGQGTAAHIAAKYGNLSIVKYVLEKDPSILKVRDDGGNTIFWIAIENGHFDVVKYFVEDQGVNISERDNRRPNGNTAIHHAAEHGQLAILKYFLEDKHGDCNITNNFQQPPVFLAVLNRHYPVIVYLSEERNANLTMIDHKNNNILFMAVNADDLSILRYVLDKRKGQFDINYKNVLGDTLVSRAALLGRYEIVKYLIGVKNAAVDITDDWGKTALHSAARKNHFQVVRYLVEHGADPRAQGEDGKLPVHETTNQRLALFLETAAKNRERRSVLNVFATQPTSFAQASTSEINEKSWPENRLEGKEAVHFGNVGTFQLQSFLMIANTVRVKMNEARLPIESSSPQEILWNKMDPIAIKAIKKLDISLI